METRGEASELQQLVSSDVENDDSTVHDENTNEEKTMSPVRSNRVGVVSEILENTVSGTVFYCTEFVDLIIWKHKS